MTIKYLWAALVICLGAGGCSHQSASLPDGGGNNKGSKNKVADYAGVTDPALIQGYEQAVQGAWQTQLVYDGRTDWQRHFFLDGEIASITPSADGMVYAAGSEEKNDAHHAVLWTHQVYEGDIKIEYEYTRLDTAIRNVTIVYVHAQGDGAEGFARDITTWSDKRVVPSMRLYFNHMETYHISYAAFPTSNSVQKPDYIRARRYTPELGLRGTELPPDYGDTGLFETGVPHKIVVIKRGDHLYMQITNRSTQYLAHWRTDKFPDLNKGRVGFRHMYTRSANYRNIRISTLNR